MKKYKDCGLILLCSILIGAGIDLFYRNLLIVPTGILGLANLLDIKYGINMALVLLVFNSLSLLLGAIFMPFKDYKKYMITAFTIPVSILIFTNISSVINLSSADIFLKSIFGAGIIGYGIKTIYKCGGDATGLDILGEIVFGKRLRDTKLLSYAIDILVVCISYLTCGLELAMHTAIGAIIIEYLSRVGMLNSSDTKVFYIITKKEEEVKNYIMGDLNSGLTIFDVVGGYSKNKSKVLMSAIKTKDYYKLREGVKNIDPKAFITITDTYEVINAELNTKEQ